MIQDLPGDVIAAIEAGKFETYLEEYGRSRLIYLRYGIPRGSAFKDEGPYSASD
jgi:hypothetical protein